MTPSPLDPNTPNQRQPRTAAELALAMALLDSFDAAIEKQLAWMRAEGLDCPSAVGLHAEINRDESPYLSDAVMEAQQALINERMPSLRAEYADARNTADEDAREGDPYDSPSTPGGRL